MGVVRLLKSVGPAAGPTVTRVAFRHPCPPYREEYERIFGGIVLFEQSDDHLDFRYNVLDEPEVHRNAELYQVLEVQAERVLKRVTEELTYSERLKRLVEHELPRVVQMPEAARTLGMSERSLRRRLAEEGVSYSQLHRADTSRARAGAAQESSQVNQGSRTRGGLHRPERISPSLQALDGHQSCALPRGQVSSPRPSFVFPQRTHSAGGRRSWRSCGRF